MKTRVISVISLLIGFTAPAPASTAQQETVIGDADTGAQLYYNHGCYACHGYSGYGRVDLNNTGSPWLVNEEIFRAFLRARANVAPVLPSTSMPNYPTNALSDEGVSDIFAYIRSLPDNQPDSADIPALRTILESAEKREYKP